MRLPVIIINDCWEYIIEVEVEVCYVTVLTGCPCGPMSAGLTKVALSTGRQVRVDPARLYRPLSRRLDRCDRIIHNESGDPNGGNMCSFSGATCTSRVRHNADYVPYAKIRFDL